jgi:predicted metal-dependent HD superfamily phosphohydrolase
MNIQNILRKNNIDCDYTMLVDMWCEKHRHYHNIEHLLDLFQMINRDYSNKLINEKTYEKLLITSLFHDVIFDPKQTDNEEKSADFFLSMCLEKNNTDIQEIKQSILDTKEHISSNPLSEKFNAYDMNIVERSFEKLLEWEQGIFKEYEFAGEKYKPTRIKFLESLTNKYVLNSDNIYKLIDYVKNNNNA